MDAAERKEILSRYMDHQRRFEAVAARRQNGQAEVIPFSGPLRALEQEPTMREIEVLQRISDGVVNREIGNRLFLSEETVKSHVRHLLAKLQARSRAHAVAVGFRRGLIAYRRSSAYAGVCPFSLFFHCLWKSLNRGMLTCCGKSKLRG